jgi:acyl-CoA hydrolase
MVFAAVDDTGKPIPVPKWQPQTANEINLEQYAKKLMDLRKDIDEEMKPYL